MVWFLIITFMTPNGITSQKIDHYFASKSQCEMSGAIAKDDLKKYSDTLAAQQMSYICVQYSAAK